MNFVKHLEFVTKLVHVHGSMLVHSVETVNAIFYMANIAER